MRTTFSLYRSIGISFIAVSVSLLSACGENACEGFEASQSNDSPQITKLRLVNQLPGDPWTAIFGLEFTDTNGDLGLGSSHAEFFLNGKSAAKVNLPAFFKGSSVPPNATSGELAVPLRFGETVKDGTIGILGVQLIDTQSHRSNCYALELDFTVSPLN